MHKNNDTPDILARIDRRSGMTVPDGYFDDFAARMSASLPDNGFASGSDTKVNVLPRTRWQRVRPYVYMAAMFAGVWCMMKMFSLMSDTHPDLSIEANPTLSEALSDESFVNSHFYQVDDDYEMLQDIYESGYSADELVDSLDAMIYEDAEPDVFDEGADDTNASTN